MVRKPTKKHPEYVVLTDVDAGFMNKTDITRCSNFKTAVDIYRRNCEIYGPFSCQILEEVVGYGEAI